MSGSFYRPIKETASPCVAASPLQSPLPAGTTPAAKAAAHAHESRPAIGAPSAAGGRLDRTEILCCAGDVIGAARGLRIGGRDRRSRKGERDRQGSGGKPHLDRCPSARSWELSAGQREKPRPW